MSLLSVASAGRSSLLRRLSFWLVNPTAGSCRCYKNKPILKRYPYPNIRTLLSFHTGCVHFWTLPLKVYTSEDHRIDQNTCVLLTLKQERCLITTLDAFGKMSLQKCSWVLSERGEASLVVLEGAVHRRGRPG